MSDEVQKDSTNVGVYMNFKDATTGDAATGLTITDLDMQYTREFTAAATKADATEGAVNSHTDNTIKEIDATSSPGLHLVCFPDAAFATGVDAVILCVSGSAIEPAFLRVPLTDYDPAKGALDKTLTLPTSLPISETPTAEDCLAYWQLLAHAQKVMNVSTDPHKLQYYDKDGTLIGKRNVTIVAEQTTTLAEMATDS